MQTVYRSIRAGLLLLSKGHVRATSMFLAGAVMLTGCQTSNLQQAHTSTAKQTPSMAKQTLAIALKKQRRQSFRYHSNLEFNNDQQFDPMIIKPSVASEHVDAYCEDRHDQAYADLLTQRQAQKTTALLTDYDAQRHALKTSYLECADAYQAWQAQKQGDDITVPPPYQQLFDHYDDRASAADIKKAQLFDAYMLKPLSINAQGIYQPLAGRATMLASVQYQARNHHSSVNQPIYIDFKNGDVYLWADNVAMLNSKLLDDKLGTKWRNKWLKIAINDGSLPKGFGKDMIKAHFAALDTTFAAAPVDQFDYISSEDLKTLSPQLPAHQLSAMQASAQVIRRVQSIASHEQFYQDYMRVFYDQIAQKHPALVDASDQDADGFTSRVMVQQMLTMIKNRLDRDSVSASTAASTTQASASDTGASDTEFQALYGLNQRGQLDWQHLRGEFVNKSTAHKNIVIDVLQQYAAIDSKEMPFPNLPRNAQVPSAGNSIDMRSYSKELMQYYRDGHGTVLSQMIFKALPMTKAQIGLVD